MELTLIPTDAGGEVRCYEFLCETEDEQEILIYINAVTGEEERIIILLKSDGGTLVKKYLIFLKVGGRMIRLFETEGVFLRRF